MPEQKEISRFGRVAEAVVGGLVTLGLLVTPFVYLAIVSAQYQERLSKLSQSLRYEVHIVEQHPFFRDRKLIGTIYSDTEPVIAEFNGHRRYKWEGVLLRDFHTSFLSQRGKYIAVDPEISSIADRSFQ